MFGLLGSSLRTLGAILGAALAALVDTEAVKSAADDMVANTRQVLHTTAANKHDGVFLKVMTFAANVGDHFFTIGKTDFSHFTKSRVRLLGRTGHYLETNTAALRAAMKSA